jgi:2'-5' RNA ligase
VLVALESWRSATYAERTDFRLPPIENLHVTLVFLGWKYEKDVERIASLALGEALSAFTLQPAGVVGVPKGRPRLHAIKLEDEGERLCRWQGEIAGVLSRAGFYEPERRPFWPHLTYARARRKHERAAAKAALPALPARLRKPFIASRVTLYRSTLKREGAVYSRISSVEASAARRVVSDSPRN